MALTPPDVARQTRGIAHVCSHCMRQIIAENFIVCTVCKNYFLCLECFSTGCHNGKHLKTHHFVLLDPSSSPMLREDWSFEEEILLLHNIHQFGLGNWADISNSLKSKSANECETHYFSAYLKSPTAPYPMASLQPPDPLLPLPSFPTDPTESCPSCGHEKKEKTTPAEVSGYMPFRGEFENEFIDDAENIVSGIDFDEANDTYSSVEKKLADLSLYSFILNERKFRTKVVEEWKIPTKKFVGLGGTTVEEKEADAKLIPFAPYIGKKAMKKMSEQTHQLLHCRSMIEQRKRWQANGITSHAEGFLFEALDQLIKDGKMNVSDVEKWNKEVEKFQRECGDADTPESKLLTKREIDLCTQENINTQLFLALKDLIIREFAVRGSLSSEEAADLSDTHKAEIQHIYALLAEMGWVWQ